MSVGKKKKKNASGEAAARRAVIDTALAMSRSGLSPNRSGNVSCRWGDGMLITPDRARLRRAQTLRHRAGGSRRHAVKGKQKKPSSEWRFHFSAYGARPDMNAVVHTHSLHAAVLACAGKPIPAFHYMVAVAGGKDIPLVPYAPFGTDELARYVAEGLADRRACLMAHHGAIAMGETLASALELAHEVEVLAEQYYKVLTLGPVHAYFPTTEMDDVLERFKSYGQKAQK